MAEITYPNGLTTEQIIERSREKNRRSTFNRRADLDAIAKLAGFTNWYQAETAIRNGELVIAHAPVARPERRKASPKAPQTVVG